METVPVRTYYLELRQPPASALPSPPETDLRRLRPCPAETFRAIYSEVGTRWGWVDRLLMPAAQLQAILDHPLVEVYQLTQGQRLAGFAELNCRALPEIELAYLGIVPDRLGQGLGPYLLSAILHRAWQHQPSRVWVHTCEWDHPAALRTYQKAGFRIYEEGIVHQAVK